MTTSTYILTRSVILLLLCSITTASAFSQEADTARQTGITDSLMNMDATYDRPFRNVGGSPVSIGGYLEANSLYTSEEGISEGLSFQARRLTFFLSADISSRIKFLSEIEFEEGGHEINIEFAAMDILLHPLVNLRGGIIMNPIGAFNENHDGPKWEFVERPEVAVNLLPATLSNPGFGLYGKTGVNRWVLGYEAYLTNGFDNSIINNDRNRTYLPAIKESSERFEESSNGKPLLTGKIAIKYRGIGELGLSYMGGTYNTFQEDGLILDEDRRLNVFAIDFAVMIPGLETTIIGEGVYALIDIPRTFTQQFGEKQLGGFLDVIQPIFRDDVFGWEDTEFNIALRLDYVDWNVGNFRETNTDIGDEVIAVTPAFSVRPLPGTVIRLNYRYQWQTDILNNPPVRAASWLFGFSTYF